MPVRRVKNLGRSYQAQKSGIEGAKELASKLRAMKSEVVGKEAQAVIAEAADELAVRVRMNAQAVGVPHDVLEDVFSYNRLPRDRKRVSSLVGIRKRGRSRPYAKAYREWFPGRKTKQGATKRPKSAKSLVLPGTMSAKGALFGLQKIGESLATMFELGTSLMPARPFFRPAVESMRLMILGMILSGYSSIINRYAKGA